MSTQAVVAFLLAVTHRRGASAVATLVVGIVVLGPARAQRRRSARRWTPPRTRAPPARASSSSELLRASDFSAPTPPVRWAAVYAGVKTRAIRRALEDAGGSVGRGLHRHPSAALAGGFRQRFESLGRRRSEPGVFTPAPNAVTEALSQSPGADAVESIDGEPVEVIDYLRMSLLVLRCHTLPLHQATDVAPIPQLERVFRTSSRRCARVSRRWRWGASPTSCR